MGGQGPAQNELDTLCKALTEDYREIKIDALLADNEEMKDCIFPSGIGYNFDIDPFMNIDCKTENNMCKEKVCNAEAEFIKSFTAIALTPLYEVLLDESLKHRDFNPVTNCVANKKVAVEKPADFKVFLKMAHPFALDNSQPPATSHPYLKDFHVDDF